MHVVGADGCRAGWLAIKLAKEEDGGATVFPTFAELWGANRHAALILVDIPIGLRDEGPEARRCDQEARKILGPRKPSVFPVPCRSAVYQPDYDAAIKENRRLASKGIFRAVWQILPKIREVDALLQANPSARQTVRESHPEVCFWALNSGKPMAYSKKTAAGIAERQGLLTRVLARLSPRFRELLDRGSALLRPGVAPDDFLDALALAVTAWLGLTQGLSTLPPEPEKDAHGLPMEIVYARLGPGAE